MVKSYKEGDELKAKIEHIFLNDEESLSKLIEVYILKCGKVVSYHELINYFVPIKSSRKRLDNNLKSLVSHNILTKETICKRIIIYKIKED